METAAVVGAVAGSLRVPTDQSPKRSSGSTNTDEAVVEGAGVGVVEVDEEDEDEVAEEESAGVVDAVGDKGVFDDLVEDGSGAGEFT